MKLNRIPMILLAAGTVAAHAQDIKVNALLEFWGTQMMDNNLRYNSAAKVSSAYYEGMSSGRFQENGFYIKRAEVYLNYKISDEWAGMAMFDPNLSTSTVGNNILQDLAIIWTPGYGVTVKAGQFKMPTTYEATIVAAKDIYFFDRNQLNRVFGDKRDRGVVATYAYGDAKSFQGKVNFGISNGNTDDGSGGKATETSAQKDYTFRFEGAFLSDHKFGFYYRTGETAVKDSSFVTGQEKFVNPETEVVSYIFPEAWTAAGVTAQQVKDNKDKTTLAGVYYAYDTQSWHADVEYATGLLGRRFPTLFASAGSYALNSSGVSTYTPTAMLREHLDQKFTGYAATCVYKMGHHQIAARYDLLNYNSGDDWYTATNPYLVAGKGDYSPKYTETTLGYNYVFVPAKFGYGKLKLDYIFRSKNFLAPRAGQTGEQGGDSIVASLMLGF